MKRLTALDKVKDLTLYTGTFGREKCTCNCIGCTQGGIIKEKEPYQGNINQIKKIIEKLPNLENAYLLGNPDISVDTDFCNEAAKEFEKNNISVMFSTSGYGGNKTIKRLVSGLNFKNIKYVSYSVDTLEDDKIHYLKGTKNISLKDIEESIKFCVDMNIPVKIQPTLWEYNQEDYIDIINYFYKKYDIKWFTFHAGSFESLKNRKVPLKHIEPLKWKEIVKNIQFIAEKKKLRIVVPRIFLNQEEMDKEKENIHTYCANGGTGLQIWLENNGIRCTYCPLLAELHPEFTFLIDEEVTHFIRTDGVCAVRREALDENLISKSWNGKGAVFKQNTENLYNVCRFFSIREQY